MTAPGGPGDEIHVSWYVEPAHTVQCRLAGGEPYPTRATECAADRIVQRLGLRNVIRDPIPESARLPGTTGLDVVFMIDTTGSMQDDIDAAKEFARRAADRIAAVDGRVALVAYRDHEDDAPVRIVTGLTEDQETFRRELAALVADGGGDDPEGLLHALMTAFDGLDWRLGATKATVVLTDATYHDPDLFGGETTQQVARRSLEIDPVNVFAVVSGETTQYDELAASTSGEVITNDGDTLGSLFEALEHLERRPVALLDRASYVVPVGRQAAFDAGASAAFEGGIASYEWDFDGDGVFEESTVDPVVRHAYSDGYQGMMQVRVTDTQGRFSNASAAVAVEVVPEPDPATPAAPSAVRVTARVQGDRVVTDWTWEGAGEQPDTWVLTVDGAVVESVPGASTSAIVTLDSLPEPTTLGVAGLRDEASGVESLAMIGPLEPPAFAAWMSAVLGGVAGGALALAGLLTIRLVRRPASRATSAEES